MKKAAILLLLHTVIVFAQDKDKYLSQHKSALNASYTLPQPQAKIIGFGAYHGSAKTEDAETLLLQVLQNQQGVDYYFAETDISLAYYFNEYLDTGNETLLKDLVIHYGTRVPQERTVNVFEKWKRIKALNDKLPQNKKLKVLGSDIIVTYKYTYRHLLSLIKDTKNWPLAQEMQKTVDVDTTDYSANYNSFSANQLKDFIATYEANPSKFDKLIRDKKMFAYIISSIKTRQLKDFNREKEMYNNYLVLREMYSLQSKTQFFRLGFFHVMKHKEGNNAPFFSMLIDNGICTKQEVVTVMGYFTKSEVLWDDIFDDNGTYLRSTNEGDFGIGDAPNEYFNGIETFKKEKTSDIWIFRLNANGSPYSTPGCTDMIEVVYDPPQKVDYGTSSTCDFIDYAVLISNSPASLSIYTLTLPRK